MNNLDYTDYCDYVSSPVYEETRKKLGKENKFVELIHQNGIGEALDEDGSYDYERGTLIDGGWAVSRMDELEELKETQVALEDIPILLREENFQTEWDVLYAVALAFAEAWENAAKSQLQANKD